MSARRAVAVAVGSSLVVAAGVPIVQGIVVAATKRPDIPGPHHQDGRVAPAGHDGEPVPIVWLGDSLASGKGAASPEAAFPRRAVALLAAAGCAVHLTCLATPGACTTDVLSDQVPAAVGLLSPGAVAVVTVGSNDVGSLTPPHRFVARYRAILGALSDTGATVVAVGLPDIGAATVIPQPLRSLAGWVGRRADRHVQRVAEAHGAHHVPIDVSPPRSTGWQEFLAVDRYHPNDHTYGLWAERTAALLTPLLHPSATAPTAAPTAASTVVPA